MRTLRSPSPGDSRRPDPSPPSAPKSPGKSLPAAVPLPSAPPPRPQTQNPISQPLSPVAFSATPGAAVFLQLAHWAVDHEPRPGHASFERLNAVLFPTPHDSRTYRLLAAESDAPALLAAWLLIVQVTARLPRPLRGLLVDRDGHPCTATDLARMTGFPAPLFVRALTFFSSPALGWLVEPPPGRIGEALQEVIDYRAEREVARRQRAVRRAEDQAARRLHRLATLSVSLHPDRPRPPWAPTAADLRYPDTARPPCYGTADPDSTVRRSLGEGGPPHPRSGAKSDGTLSDLRDLSPEEREGPPGWRETFRRVLPPRTAAEDHLYTQLLWPELTPALQHQIRSATPAPSS